MVIEKINKTERTFSPKPPDKTRNARKMLEMLEIC